jgi:two-component system phosphate regulon sensor histidine kinase PhoR
VETALPVAEVLAALPFAALAIERTARISALNPAAQTLLGMPAQGRHFVTVLRQPAVVAAVEQCLAGAHRSTAACHLRQNGSDASYTVSVSRLGAAGAVLVVFQDMTAVSAAGRMRRDFVANVSHELRTPLTALMGFIETLQGPARDDAVARRRFLAIMQTQTERMNRLVGDLLSLSRVEAQEQDRPHEQVDLVEILHSTLRTLAPVAARADVVLVPDFPAQTVMLAGDADQLVQVFTNLVENAVKYGGADTRVFVTLRSPALLEALRAPGVEVSVRDEGAGIAAHHLPRLTERFYRADSHRNRDLGGTGLGLAIVKHILNRHRGRLKITSQTGQGAEFRVFLPLE